jgi:rRNA maturation endonuclease Nob1
MLVFMELLLCVEEGLKELIVFLHVILITIGMNRQNQLSVNMYVRIVVMLEKTKTVRVKAVVLMKLKKPNRISSRKPRKGQYFCWGCDRALVSAGSKCPVCGKKQLPRRSKK